VYAIGGIAQLLFSARTLLQWIISERNKKVLTPSLFWKLSLIASFLLFVYGYLRNDFAIMLGQVLTYFIYVRNMQLQGEWNRMHQLVRIFIIIFPLIIITIGYNNNKQDIYNLLNSEAIPDWLLYLGIISQIIFTLRFVYQWIYSERKKESSLPLGFWMLSLLGASLIFLYAIFRKDPILIAGHTFGIITYIRNIMLLRNHA
jgi:lipid-A-disaccharide synthase-like uncharacterized protein